MVYLKIKVSLEINFEAKILENNTNFKNFEIFKFQLQKCAQSKLSLKNEEIQFDPTQSAEAVVRRRSVKKVFLEILQNFFFLSGFLFTTIHESQDCRGPFHFFNSSLRLLPASQTEISPVITAESSPLHIASSRAWTGNLWFPSASH